MDAHRHTDTADLLRGAVKGGHALLQDEEQADEGGPSSVQS